MGIRQNIKHLRRYRQIVHVLMQHGLGYLIQRAGLAKLITLSGRQAFTPCEREPDYCLAGKLRLALMDLGPTFVKLGQLASTRPDLLPPAYIEELEHLQDKVQPFPYAQVIEQLVKEIGHPDDIFAEFNQEPLAAASIGQVHEARLKTGEKVIVKIQRPNIEAQVENDLEILLGLAKLIENRVPEARQIGLVAVIEDFAKLLRRELDYDRESRNTERVRHSFAEDERIVIPQVYWDYTTPRVLTEEFIDGIKFSNISEIEARGWDRQKISSIATEAFLTQIMIHGFFNSDPHPGNMLIIDQERISFIDFGQVGQLTPKRLEKIGILLWRLGNKDLDGALAALQDMGIVGENIPVEDFQADLADLVEQVSTGNIGNINLEQLRKDIFDLAFRYHLQMPSYLTALMKALITVEGVGKKLDPTFDFIEVAKPIAKKMVREQIKPDNLWQTARRNYYSDLRPLISFPKNFNNLIKTTGEGKLNMQIQIGFNSEARTKMTQLVNRLSASLVIAGGLIGSAFILSSDVNPSLNHGNTVIGFIGFTVSLLGLLALLSFLRSK